MNERTLIIGGYGYGNLGDEAMLGGLLAKWHGTPVTVVSRDPARTGVLHGVPAIPISRALPALLTHGAVVIGGGSLFGRDMGRIGRLLPAFGLLAHLLRRRVMLEGIGLDDVATSSRTVRQLLSVAASVSVRDAASLELAHRWGVDATMQPDLSTQMAEAKPGIGRALLTASGVDLRVPVVGLCLTAVQPRLAERVLPAISSVMASLPGVEFVFIPMSRHPSIASHDDLVFGRELQRRQPRMHLLEADAHPAQVLSVFRSLDVAVCMRLHSLLFAERAGTPIVPIAYASKCATWLAERRMASFEPTAEMLTTAIAGLLPAERRAG